MWTARPSPTVVTTSNVWTMTAANGLAASSTHSFRVDYADNGWPPVAVVTVGQRHDLERLPTIDGIPFEWMEQYYGYNFVNWPVNVNAPLAPGGLSLMQVFLSGGNPLDPATWLRTAVEQYAARLVPELEPPAGIHLSGAIDGNLGRRLDQSGRAAVRGRDCGIQSMSARVPPAITASCSCASELCMRQLKKAILWIGCLALGLQTAGAFSLLGPITGTPDATWQITLIGYNPLSLGAAPPGFLDPLVTGPKNHRRGISPQRVWNVLRV